jgi:hypothetical protein
MWKYQKTNENNHEKRKNESDEKDRSVNHTCDVSETNNEE